MFEAFVASVEQELAALLKSAHAGCWGDGAAVDPVLFPNQVWAAKFGPVPRPP